MLFLNKSLVLRYILVFFLINKLIIYLYFFIGLHIMGIAKLTHLGQSYLWVSFIVLDVQQHNYLILVSESIPLHMQFPLSGKFSSLLSFSLFVSQMKCHFLREYFFDLMGEVPFLGAPLSLNSCHAPIIFEMLG